MKNQLTCLIILGILAIFISSCSVSTTRIGALNPGYFNNRGEGNVSGKVFVDNFGSGFGGHFNYAMSDNIFIGCGVDYFNPETDYYDFGAGDVGIKGFNGRFTMGGFKSIGVKRTGYFESSFTITKGWQNFIYQGSSGLNNIAYSPSALSGLIGWGINKKNIGFLGGLNLILTFSDFKEPHISSFIPDEYVSDDGNLNFNVFFGSRFGRGPIKFSILWSLGTNHIAGLGSDTADTPRVNFSLGVHYNFGRTDFSIIKM